MNDVIDLIPRDGNIVMKARLILTDELLSNLYGNRYLCRQKLMNMIYLCENHFNLSGINGVYYQTLSGPANFHMLGEIEKKLDKLGWKKTRNSKKDTSIPGYYRTDKYYKCAFRKYNLNTVWHDKSHQIRHFAKIMKPMNSEETMMIATIYAVWNDLMLSKMTFSDNDILGEVLDAWNMRCHRISKFSWRKTMAWLRSAQITPQGYGQKTIPVKAQN